MRFERILICKMEIAKGHLFLGTCCGNGTRAIYYQTVVRALLVLVRTRYTTQSRTIYKEVALITPHLKLCLRYIYSSAYYAKNSLGNYPLYWDPSQVSRAIELSNRLAHVWRNNIYLRFIAYSAYYTMSLLRIIHFTEIVSEFVCRWLVQ